jgi:hypothetical protein
MKLQNCHAVRRSGRPRHQEVASRNTRYQADTSPYLDRSCTRLGRVMEMTPVAFQPGRLRPVARPDLTGSMPVLKTIGIVVLRLARRRDDCRVPLDQIGRQFRQPTISHPEVLHCGISTGPMSLVSHFRSSRPPPQVPLCRQ